MDLIMRIVIDYGVTLNCLLAALFCVIHSLEDMPGRWFFLFLVGAVLCSALTLQISHCLKFF